MERLTEYEIDQAAARIRQQYTCVISKSSGQWGHAAGRIRALMSGLPPHKRRRRRFIVFQAFIDDSGSGVPVFVLSGYVAPVYWWESFSEEWQSLLDQPPKLKYFKMREAAQLSGEFSRMRVGQRNERIKTFFDLIRKAAHQSVSAVIPMQPYRRIVKGRIRKEWDDPYFIALFDIVSLLLEGHFRLKFAGRVEKESVLDFIFDDNPKLAAKVPYWYQLTRSLLHPVLKKSIGASARFEDDHDFLPLQAADAQSWYYRRVFAEKFGDEPFKADLPKEIFAELDKIPSALSFWSPMRMRYFVEGSNRGKPVKAQGKRFSEIKRFKDIHDIVANADMES